MKLGSQSRFIAQAGTLGLLVICVCSTLVAQGPTISDLTIEQKVGQMVFPRLPGTFLSDDDPGLQEVVALARSGTIGGVVLFGGDPLSVKSTIDRLQAASALPLLIGLDAEWGIGMRLDGGLRFPVAMAVGATDDRELAQEVGRVTAVEALELGIHLILAPVLDLAVEPDNRVIGTRSFGSDPEKVGVLGAAFVRGVQAAGALAVAKHFPGHGATVEDSHFELPRLTESLATLRERELVPFRAVVDAGVAGVMPAHLVVTALDDDDTPASRSQQVLRGLLRRELGFDGLIVSDALDMEGARGAWHGSVVIDAVKAGTDLLLLPPYPRVAVDALVRAVARGEVSEQRLDESVSRILQAKTKLGLLGNRPRSGSTTPLTADRSDSVRIAQQIARAAVTWVKPGVGQESLTAGVPGRCFGGTKNFGTCWNGKVLVISLLDEFDRTTNPRMVARELGRRAESVNDYWVRPSSAADRDSTILEAIADADAVLVASYASRRSWGRLRLVPEVPDRQAEAGANANAGTKALATEGAEPDDLPAAQNKAQRLGGREALSTAWAWVDKWIGAAQARGIPAVFVTFGDPWTLALGADAELGLFDASTYSQTASVQAIYGEHSITGRLPVEVVPTLTSAEDVRPRAMESRVLDRPRWSAEPVTDPSTLGLEPGFAREVREVLHRAVSDKAFPGAAAMVLRHGRVVFHEAVGRLSYDLGAADVELDTLYDIASLTKVVVTTTLCMLLEERGLLDLNAPVQRYLPEFAGPAKAGITVLDLLSHTSGILWWTDLYKRHGERTVPTERSRVGYLSEIFGMPLNTEPRSSVEYSDLGILLLGEILERTTGRTLDELAQGEIFRPLSMRSTTYRPTAAPASLPLSRIAPTEMDPEWRGRLVWGEVHDENAAGLGGIAPHAGVFSTASDLGRFLQMLMNGGHLDGVRLLKQSTIRRYTQRTNVVEASSRAIGWDTPSGRSSAGDYFAAGSFGHTGFTGTSLWVDAVREVAVVLLTNRVHPTRDNRKISAVRRELHDAVMLGIKDVVVTKREQ